jgi:hypothetical protein
MQKPPEKIYLVPSEDGWNWAEDPAQGAGMEASDSIAYLAVNGSERALVSAAPSDDHATLVKQFRALSNLANALQARATHAERKLAACDHNAISFSRRVPTPMKVCGGMRSGRQAAGVECSGHPLHPLW